LLRRFAPRNDDFGSTIAADSSGLSVSFLDNGPSSNPSRRQSPAKFGH
jgi:hypothetical protein